MPHPVVFNEATREATVEIDRLKQEFAEFAPFLPIALRQLSSYRRVYPYGRGVPWRSRPADGILKIEVRPTRRPHRLTRASPQRPLIVRPIVGFSGGKEQCGFGPCIRAG
jgi:hypothetical protein